MYLLITIFYLSFIGIVVMLVLKRNELKNGKSNFISRFSKKTDHIFQTIFDGVSDFLSYINKHTFVAIAHWLAVHALFRIRKVYVHAKQRTLDNHHGRKIIDAVRGRGEVKNHGASFYLRRISEDKGNRSK